MSYGNAYLCPHCNCSMVLSERNHERQEFFFKPKEDGIARQLEAELCVCSNPECGKASIHVAIRQAPLGEDSSLKVLRSRLEQVYSGRLIPPPVARLPPACVPPGLVADYMEACLIKDASPKAAATLIRRCLQGMIRDFWGAKGKSLADEIESIKDRIDPDTWEAIGNIRKIGNIGAHMEKDINLIIDVDPREAELLIGLVGDLFDEWYVNRERKRKRNAGIAGGAKRMEALRHREG